LDDVLKSKNDAKKSKSRETNKLQDIYNIGVNLFEPANNTLDASGHLCRHLKGWGVHQIRPLGPEGRLRSETGHCSQWLRFMHIQRSSAVAISNPHPSGIFSTEKLVGLGKGKHYIFSILVQADAQSCETIIVKAWDERRRKNGENLLVTIYLILICVSDHFFKMTQFLMIDIGAVFLIALT
jgi:hypothetical protein